MQHRIWQAESDVKQPQHNYQWTYRSWLRNEQWHKVVELYAGALIKEIAAQRPPLVKLPAPSLDVGVDYEALSLHLDRVAVELADYANTVATKDATPQSEKTFGQLGADERKAILEPLASAIERHIKSAHKDIPDYLESIGLPRDITLAAQEALTKYGEFATAGEIDNCTTSRLAERIKVVIAKKEWELLFGMKIDRESRTVKRFTKGNDRDSVCTISNDEQWRLFMLMVSHGGTVAASVVQNMLPIISERGNAKQRLKDKLGEIQLTFEHVAGTGYVLKEFPG